MTRPDLLTLLDQVLDRLVGHFGAGAHHDDHALGVGRADIVKEVVLAAGDAGEFVHRLLDDLGRLEVEGIDRLAGLEEHVRVLGCAADERAAPG